MSIYQNIYDILHQYIFGLAELTPIIDLAITLVSLCACIFCVSLPFLLVWKVLKMVTR